jgi:hypothetical protein
MKNPLEVLRNKEQELVKVKREVDALRITLRLIEEHDAGAQGTKGDKKVDLRELVQMP